MIPACRRCRSLIRSFSSMHRESDTSGLRSFEQDYYGTPPVVFLQDTQPPTALQWLRRRGPQLPNGVLQQLFRKRRVKVFTPAEGRVQRAVKEQLLPPGARVLIPKEVAAGALEARRISEEAYRGGQLAGAGEELRARILYQDEELLVLNKPPGLAVQGGRGISVSLDRLAERELGQGSLELPRLVHRLDKDTSGAIVLARTADAAAWLSTAFGQPSRQPHDASTPAAWVKKTYWAIVEADPALPEAGTIEQPLARDTSGLPAALQPALTHFAVRARMGPLAWLELNPVTGRKHQLRLHCAKFLNSPVLGDARYGASKRLVQAYLPQGEGQSQFLRSLKPAIHLHCRHLELKRPGRQRWTVTAPLPLHMAAEFKGHGWVADQ